jgi:hypothetical protein
MSARDLFRAVSGEYESFRDLEARIITEYRANFAQFPTMFAMSSLLEIGREHGWIQSTDQMVRVDTTADAYPLAG